MKRQWQEKSKNTTKRLWGDKMDDLITVIVPIYNVELYLRKCVDSIINQTYKNIEIILVDDGSTDSCGEICDSYADLDKRIIVIHKENGGLSDARNAGIDILKGKYVTFIDSDDWVEPNYVEQLYRLLVENDADLSVCDFYYVDSENNLYNTPATDERVFVWNREEALLMLLSGNKMNTSAWCKLYKSKFFIENKVRFPKGKLYEDIPVAYEILLEADKIVYGNYALYNYFIRPQSISSTNFSPRKMHAIEHTEAAVPQILQQFPKFDKLCAVALFQVNFNIYLILDKKDENIKYEKQLIRAIKKYRNAVIFSKNLNIKWRIKALTTYLGLPVSKALFAQRSTKRKK